MGRDAWNGLYFPNALLSSVALSLSLAVAVRCLANRVTSQRRLQTRMSLLASVVKIVEKWEEPCLREVEKRVVTWKGESTPCDSLFNSHAENGRGEKPDIAPFHGAVRSMAYAPGVNLRQWLRLWRAGRYLCASTVEDMLWIQRLGYIIKFVAFKRLSLMAETRYYAALLRSVLYGGDRRGKTEFYASSPSMPAWLVGRRPFWIIPLSGMGSRRFLCLPLSYFPVETILTSMAEETWMKELVDVLPLFTEELSLRFVPDMLRIWRTRRLVKDLVEVKFPPQWRRLWDEINYLFLTYGTTLAKGQLQRRELACRRFYEEKLFGDVEMVTGDGVDTEDMMMTMMEGSHYFPFKYKNKQNVKHGCDVLLRNSSASRRLKMLLRLRTCSHAIRVAIGLMTPQYNLFAEWMLFNVLSSVKSDMGREKIIMEFSCHVLRSSLATVLGAVVTSIDYTVKGRIRALLRKELNYELSVKLATSDESFLRRCVEENVTGRENPVEMSSVYSEDVASQILTRFDDERRKIVSRLFVLLFSVWRRDVSVALFAATVAMLDYHETARALGCWLGITVGKELDRELMRIDDEGPPPAEPRYGLLLLIDVLIEEKEKTRGRERMLIHPSLALVVCGGTFLLEWPVSVNPPTGIHNNNNSVTTNSLCRLQAIEKFIDDVIHDNSYSLRMRKFSSNPHGICYTSLVESLRLNATFVKNFVLYSSVKKHEARRNYIVGNSNEIFSVDKSLFNTNSESILNAEEIYLLQDPQSMSHVPRTLSFEDVFDKAPRFILRQLGLETIFAYTAATLCKQSGSRSLTESLVDFVSGPFDNVFSRTFVQLMEFMERVLFYGFFSHSVTLPWGSCFRRDGYVSSFITTHLCGSGGGINSFHNNTTINNCWDAVSLLGRMTGYRAALKEYTVDDFGPPFRLVLQLSRYLPTTLHDVSPVHYTPLLAERRQAWKRFLQEGKGGEEKHGKLEFDNIGRIIGGFSLSRSIELRGVYFAYPQLHHSMEDGSLQPILSDVTITIPAGYMTVIIGPTGSGKSTVMNLLKRMYDPLPVIEIHEDDDTLEITQALLIHILHSSLSATLPLPPLPPTEGDVKNIILLDNIPISCFSTSYLRASLGMLEQMPCVFDRVSFFQNISLFVPNASMEEVISTAKLCGCNDFIESRSLAYDAVAGALSSGEKQRLALTRAMVMGRRGSGVFLLDEPTARLDGYNEGCIEEALEGLLESSECMTFVIISHRLSTLRAATYCVVLDDGRVVFYGLFKDAKKSCLYFEQLVAAQSLQVCQ